MVALGRRTVAPPALAVLLQDAAALLAEMFDTEYSGMAEVLPDMNTLRHHLTFRDGCGQSEKLDTVETTLSGSESLAGYVLEVAHPVVVANLPGDRRFHDAFLRRRGILSAVVTPLRLPGEAFGALGAYSTRLKHFQKDDLLFIESIGHLIATTMGRCRAEEQLYFQRKLSQGVLQGVSALVLVLDPQWRIVHVNRACLQTTGFGMDEIAGRPIWDVFTIPEEVSLFRTLRDRLRKSDRPIEYESYLQTKHGSRRRIAWSYQAVHEGDSQPPTIIATGIDATDRYEAEQKLAEVRREVEKARAEIAELKQASAEPSDAGGTNSEAAATAAPFSSLPTPLNAERRQRPRRSYPYSQRVAPVIKGELPDKEDFEEIECNDIAAGGFSFFAAQPPKSDSLIVALGTAPKITYLMAQVAHITRLTRNGRRMYLIGCSYTGRIHY
ncbi:MAG: PAS domain S-box protein [Thermoguttaceae bacterium]|nr:PAS domain S-box protein [Thermoguttaceae bacterium]